MLPGETTMNAQSETDKFRHFILILAILTIISASAIKSMHENKKYVRPITFDVFEIIQVTETATTNITLRRKNSNDIFIVSVIAKTCDNLPQLQVGTWWALETYITDNTRMIRTGEMCRVE
jgi:hypothetical protein